jgi:hypothetical protein
MEDNRLKGFCRVCHDWVYLEESLREFRNEKLHIEGRCGQCSGFVKFISHKESFLKRKMDQDGSFDEPET